MRPQTFNRTEKKDIKLNKAEKVYNANKKAKDREAARKKVAVTA